MTRRENVVQVTFQFGYLIKKKSSFNPLTSPVVKW